MFTNWVTFAMGCYMAQDYKSTLDSINSVFKFDNENPVLKPHEKNALRLLEARCYGKQGKNNEAFKMLKNRKKVIVDKIAYWKYVGDFANKIGKTNEAIKAFDELLALNPSNYETYYSIIETKGLELPADKTKLARHKLSGEDQAKLLEILSVYIEKFPRINSMIRISLKLIHDELFA
jgi:tetratricopeptide (TPR) repeat protein